MHTDEYEISLSRELNVCERKIAQIRKALLLLERKYNIKNKVPLDKFVDCEISGQGEGMIAWMKEFESLKKWEALRDEYAEQLNKMKI